jgi:hypothetical protein
MDVHPNARGALASERTKDMADMRRCIGSAKFGIEAHEAPPDDFPAQPSQKDGLGRMCKPHWRAYTGALRKAALARKAAEGAPAAPGPAEAPEPIRTKAPRGRKAGAPEPIRTKAPRGRKLLEPAVGSQGDAG